MPISSNPKIQKLGKYMELFLHTGFTFSKNFTSVAPGASCFVHADGRRIEIIDPEWVLYTADGTEALSGTLTWPDLTSLRKLFVNHMTREELIDFINTANFDRP